MASLGQVIQIAQGMLDRFGAEAPQMLAKQIAQHCKEGDLETAMFWQRVLHAMNGLKATAAKPGPGADRSLGC